MNRHDYLELMFRTLEAEATAAEQQALQQWLNETPENRKWFAEMEKIWQAARSQTPKYIPDVNVAWQKVAGRIQVSESPRVIPFRRRKVSLDTLFFSRIWPALSAVAAVLVLALYGGYRLSLPEYYELALLTQSEQKNLYPETRGEPSASQSEFAQGAEALLSASRYKWGLIPYFDPQQVMKAITHLQDAYAQTDDPVSRNKYACYLGKAYLMQEDVATARQWLNRVLASEAVAYQDEAKSLLERLD